MPQIDQIPFLTILAFLAPFLFIVRGNRLLFNSNRLQTTNVIGYYLNREKLQPVKLK